MPLLYKYLSPENTDKGTPLPLLVLEKMQLSATNPCTFNDPFEVRPWFDQERHDHAARTQESFDRNVYGLEHSLIAGQSMTEIPTERASGFGEQSNKPFRDEVGRKFRILCLSQNPKSVLMWGHYARSHTGIVLGINTGTPGFHQGLQQDGFTVKYLADRSQTKLPLAYYQSPCVEECDIHG